MTDTQARIRITAQNDTDAAFKKAQSNFQALEAEAIGVAARLGSVLAVGAFASLVKDSIDAADHLRDLSQATGIAAQELGGLGFAASQNGGSLDSVASAAGKLNKSIAEAAAGSKEALEPFRLLGISVKDAAGNTKTADVVFAEVADRFKTFNDGPEKSALALRLFGKAGAEQIALLNEGGDALRANTEYYKRFSGVTEDLNIRADQFNDTLGKIKLLGQSLGTTIAAELMPSLQAVADELLRAKEEGSGFSSVAKVIKIAFETVAVIGANVAFVFGGIGREIGAIAAQTVALARLDLKGFNAISEAVKADGIKARYELDGLERRILGIRDDDQTDAESRRLGLTKLAPVTKKGNAPRLGGGGGGKERKELDLANKAIESYIEALQKQLDKTQDLTAVEETLLLLQRKGTGATLDQAAAALGLARALDKQAEQEERIKLGRQLAAAEGEAVEARNASYRTMLANLYSATPTAKLEEQRKAVRALTDEFEKGDITVQKYNEAVTAFLGLDKKPEEFSDDFGKNLNSDVRDALANAFRDSKNPAEAFAAALGNVVFTRLSQAATGALADLLVGTGKPGSDGGLLGSAAAAIFGGFKAEGGPVKAGTAYVVGERGRELFVPRTAGTVVPNSQLGGTGQVSIHINNQLTGVTPAMLEMNNARMLRQIQGGLVRSMNYGGAIS